MPPKNDNAQTFPPPILVVDDDPTQRLMLKQVLEMDGHSVIEAAGGKQALELFQQHRPILALLDAVMPEMDGFELCERLHTMEGGEQLTVLMATSLSDKADINHAFAVGAADFISKPINLSVLRGRVKYLLQAKLAEHQMREAEEQLRQSQKMVAIGNLSSGIAHEFNNILTSVMGYTELLQEFLSHMGEERPRKYANEIHNATGRARDLIHQMQLFSQSRSGEAQMMAAKTLVRENLKIIRSSLPATIILTQHLDNDLPQIKAEPAQFQQLLTNLLINARDAIDGKGAISVGMRRVNLPEQSCHSCHSSFSGNFVELTVSDSGCGIPAEVQEKMFEPYYTTKPVGRGTGMGLPVVHGIMHKMGGHIRVKSNNEEGTRISLLFPNNKTPEEDATMEQEKQALNTHHAGQRVLLVDDEVSITGYLGELLELHGYKVTISNDSQHALDLFCNAPADFDLVITDMTLPGITGIELASNILQQRPELPVILCSGYIDDATKQLISDTGIRKAFNKPIDSRALIESMDHLLHVA